MVDRYSLRVLVLAPIGRDSKLLVQALSAAGIAAEASETLTTLCEQIRAGAGAALLGIESLAPQAQQQLARVLNEQPEWSDFPLVVMDAPRRGSGTKLPPVLDFSSHAIVLVRPVHRHTLVSTLRSALRARLRQYQVRDELAERRQVEEALKESHKRKDEFLAMLGHELRNPLAAVRSATELVKLTAPESERIQRAHAVLDRQSTHMARLIDGLLEVSRIARGKIKLDPVVLDLCEVVDLGVKDRLSEIEARGLELIYQSAAGPVWIRGDRVRLAQVLDNLLANAIKFSNEAGSIHVALSSDGNDAVLRVVDQGIGIQREMLDRLFDAFQQDTQDISRPAGGLGLGLALAKGLIELHGGSIHAHSAGRGSGSEFEVRLPLVLAPSKAQQRTPPRPAEVAPMRVLIVEDNVDAGQSLRDLLEVLGHQVSIAMTGTEALSTLRTRGADAVLCDLGLPGMSGYSVAREVRDDVVLRRTPLVALTGYGQIEDRRRSAEAGFDAHLTKPVDAASLMVVLAEACAHRSGRDQQQPESPTSLS